MRSFYTIDGNPAKCTKVVGYCKHHKGCMTQGLVRTHGCEEKGCEKLIVFEYTDKDIDHDKRRSSRRVEAARV